MDYLFKNGLLFMTWKEDIWNPPFSYFYVIFFFHSSSCFVSVTSVHELHGENNFLEKSSLEN